MSYEAPSEPKSNPIVYRAEKHAPYRGNRLIEALPPVPSRAEAYKALAHRPTERPASFRSAPVEQKLDMLSELQQVFVPTSEHIHALQAVVRVVRQCYLARDFDSKEVQSRLAAATGDRRIGLTRLSKTGGGSNGMVLWGCTGAGKTSFLDRVQAYIGSIPLFHTLVQGRPCRWPQLPVVRIQCKTTLAGTIAQAVAQVDEKLGTNHLRALNSRSNRDSHVALMSYLASVYFWGILIVEDAHKLKDSASVILEYFCDLMEETGMPVMLVSTYKFRALLMDDLAVAGKLMAQGLIDFRLIDYVGGPSAEQLKHDDWTALVTELWNLNVYSKAVPMPAELPRWLHFHTLGVRRIAREMMVAAFTRSLYDSKVQTITSDLLDEIAADELIKYQEALDTLRKRFTGEPISDEDASKFEHFILPTEADDVLRNVIKKRKHDESTAVPEAAPRTTRPKRVTATESKRKPRVQTKDRSKNVAHTYEGLAKSGRLYGA